MYIKLPAPSQEVRGLSFQQSFIKITKGTFLPNYIEICPVVSHKNILKVFFFRLSWQPEFCMDCKSLDNLQSASPLKLAQWFRRRCNLKKLWTDGRQRTVSDHNSFLRSFGSVELKRLGLRFAHNKT